MKSPGEEHKTTHTDLLLSFRLREDLVQRKICRLNFVYFVQLLVSHTTTRTPPRPVVFPCETDVGALDQRTHPHPSSGLHGRDSDRRDVEGGSVRPVISLDRHLSFAHQKH